METRREGRPTDALRALSFHPSFQEAPLGAVQIQMGNTLVHCAVTLEDKVPPFRDPETEGWLTAEYAMLPTATHSRSQRESARGRQSGRTMEIQRLIGRSLRCAVDLKAMPGKSILVDCDVLQADGGTRTASITGACVALKIALDRAVARGILTASPFKTQVAAISVGLVDGMAMMDLDYPEDSRAEADMNIVMTEDFRFVELQATAEGRTVHAKDMDRLLVLARKGIETLLAAQNEYFDGWSKK